jgi:uncharacterized protein with PQ loop repeat
MDGLVRRHRHQTNNSGQPLSTWHWVVEKSTIIAGVLGPVMTAPQIYKIYYFHSAAGVSTLSWLAFGILDIPFLVYGVVHKEKPILITYILWMIANFSVAVGAMVYR